MRIAHAVLLLICVSPIRVTADDGVGMRHSLTVDSYGLFTGYYEALYGFSVTNTLGILVQGNLLASGYGMIPGVSIGGRLEVPFVSDEILIADGHGMYLYATGGIRPLALEYGEQRNGNYEYLSGGVAANHISIGLGYYLAFGIIRIGLRLDYCRWWLPYEVSSEFEDKLNDEFGASANELFDHHSKAGMNLKIPVGVQF